MARFAPVRRGLEHVIDERFAPVLEEARRQVASGLRPSIQLAVEWRGRRVLETAVGADADSRSSYLLWSSTKPFVAVALLQQIEEGRAELDDRVAKFVPEFGRGGKERATLAHVLSHRGGFPDNRPELQRDRRSVMLDWDRALRWVCELPAAWEPGTDRGYHPFSGWLMLGEVAQRLDERPLPEIVRRRVLDPLGIAEDAFSLGSPERLASAPRLVRAHPDLGARDAAEADYWNQPATLRAVIPGGGGISRAGEVVKLYSALLAGGAGANGRVLGAEMVRIATFPHAVGIPDRTFLRDIPWGLGFHLKHVRPSLDDCGDSATPGTYGHAGHFLVNTAWADPGKGLAACVLADGTSEPRAGIAAVRRLSQAIHDVVDSARAK